MPNTITIIFLGFKTMRRTTWTKLILVEEMEERREIEQERNIQITKQSSKMTKTKQKVDVVQTNWT
jgi:hypothetical protein